jgi:hypothetical protein
MSTPPVLAVGAWSTNAKMIADVSKLGYLDGKVVDLSFGRGKFWTEFRPSDLEVNDIEPGRADWQLDVTKTPREAWVGLFDAAVWDPPYRLSGKRDGRTAKNETDFDDRYGTQEYVSPKGVQSLINSGILYAAHVVKPGGHILVKCQTQVAGGKKRFQPSEAVRYAHLLGDAEGLKLKQVDEFHLVTRGRKQPDRRQIHSRSNFSTLIVFRKQA